MNFFKPRVACLVIASGLLFALAFEQPNLSPEYYSKILLVALQFGILLGVWQGSRFLSSVAQINLALFLVVFLGNIFAHTERSNLILAFTQNKVVSILTFVGLIYSILSISLPYSRSAKCLT